MCLVPLQTIFKFSGQFIKMKIFLSLQQNVTMFRRHVLCQKPLLVCGDHEKNVVFSVSITILGA